MQRQDILPSEFEPIAHLVKNVRKESQDEYSGSCPNCGEIFSMFILRKYNFSFGACSGCGFSWSSGKKPTEKQFEEWKKTQIEILKKRSELCDRAIGFLKNDEIWEDK